MKKKKNQKILIVIAALLLIAVVALTWPNNGRNKSTQGSGATTPSSSSQSTSLPPTTPETTPASSTKQPTPSSGVTASLIAPTGSFVSNHHPNLGGSPAPNQEQSVCNTTPGATCNIEFTKSGVVKSLGSKITDSSGATYWTWTLQGIGLTQGSWKIVAVATLNGQTRTAEDALAIDVQP